MLPELKQIIDAGTIQADSFFRGRVTETGDFWRTLHVELDLYGSADPEYIADVYSSAIASSKALGLEMCT